MDFGVRCYQLSRYFRTRLMSVSPPKEQTIEVMAAHLSPIRAGRASRLRCRSGVLWTRLDWQTLNNTRKRGDELKNWTCVFFLGGFRVSGSSTCQRGEIMWNNMILKLFFARTDATESWLKVKQPSQCLLYYVLVLYLSSTKWHDNLWELSHWYMQIDCHTAIIWRWTPRKREKLCELWVYGKYKVKK